MRRASLLGWTIGLALAAMAACGPPTDVLTNPETGASIRLEAITNILSDLANNVVSEDEAKSLLRGLGIEDELFIDALVKYAS